MKILDSDPKQFILDKNLVTLGPGKPLNKDHKYQSP